GQLHGHTAGRGGADPPARRGAPRHHRPGSGGRLIRGSRPRPAMPDRLPDTSSFLPRLADPPPLPALELRPPRAPLPASEGLEAWIDANHAVRRLAATDTIVFITDNATGSREEENLQHLLSNVGPDADPGKLVPFLTCKHTLDYCTWYAQRAAQGGYRAL